MKLKRSLVSVLASVAVTIGLALPAFARPAVITGSVPGSRVNVRSAPTMTATAPSYGLVGDRVEVLDQTSGKDGYTWYYVRFASGAEGWIRGDFVSVIGSKQGIPAVLVGRAPGSRVNVRSGPSTTSPAPSYGLVGDRVVILNQTSAADGFTWYYVQFPSRAEGWVRGDFVAFVRR